MTGMSVIVASYRRPDQLVECLDGLAAQIRAPAEVIVVAHISDRPNAAYVDERAAVWAELRGVIVEQTGTVAAYNTGLGAARHELVAFIDDDAVPEPDWIERLVAIFAQDQGIAAVGGRDVIEGHVLEPGSADVGRLQWFGRMIGNHHRGVGVQRDVDILKGVNMAFRRAEVIEHGFDRRLRGRFTQMNSELSICLPLRRRGLRIVYDPSIVVRHYGAARPAGDHRDQFDGELTADAVHNETLQVLDYFGPAQRGVFAIWASLVGTSYAPGLLAFMRDLVCRRPHALHRLLAGQRGRVAGWRTHRGTRRFARVLSRLGHRPAWSWRSRHIFGASGPRPRPGCAAPRRAEARRDPRSGG